MTLEQVRGMLRDRAVDVGGQKQLAEKIGVSPQHLSDVIGGKRSPGQKILAYFKLGKTVVYEKPQKVRTH